MQQTLCKGHQNVTTHEQIDLLQPLTPLDVYLPLPFILASFIPHSMSQDPLGHCLCVHDGRHQGMAVTRNCPPTKTTHNSKLPSQEIRVLKEEGYLDAR